MIMRVSYYSAAAIVSIRASGGALSSLSAILCLHLAAFFVLDGH